MTNAENFTAGTRLNGGRNRENTAITGPAARRRGRGGATGVSFVAAVSGSPRGARRTCTGTGPVRRSRTGADRDPVHRNTGICTWAWKNRKHSNVIITIIY